MSPIYALLPIVYLLEPLPGSLQETVYYLFSLDWLSWKTLIKCLGYLGLGLIVLKSFHFTLNQIEKGLQNLPLQNEEHKKRFSTSVQMIENASNWLFVIVTIYLLLGEFGVNTAPLWAGAGILGAAVAFGCQSIMKDIISGFFMAAEAHFGPGDVIQVSGVSGKVERMTLRTVTIVDALDKKHIIPNSEFNRYTICPAPAQWEAMEWEILFSQADVDLTDCLAHLTLLLNENFPEGFHEGPTIIFTEHVQAARSPKDNEKRAHSRIRLRAKAKLENYPAMTEVLTQWLFKQDPASTCCGWVSTLPNAAISPSEIK